MKHNSSNTKVLKIFIDQFFAEIDSLLFKLEESIQRNHAETLTSVSHYLQGVICIFFAKPPVDKLITLENLGKADDTVAARVIVPQLRKDISMLTSDLNLISERINQDSIKAS